MSTHFPTELWSKSSKYRRTHPDPVILTALNGTEPDLGSPPAPDNTVVDYECPRNISTTPDPAALTAPRGTVPDFGGMALPQVYPAATDFYGRQEYVSDHVLIALEVAKTGRNVLIFGSSSSASSHLLQPPPTNFNNFAIPATPSAIRYPPHPRRTPAAPAPRPPPSTSPASDSSSSDQLSDASTSSGKSGISGSRAAGRRHRQRETVLRTVPAVQ